MKAKLLGDLAAVLLGCLLLAPWLSPTPAGAQPGEGSPGALLGLLSLQQAQLIAIDGHESDHFGSAVALDGDTALVGSHGDDFGLSVNQGSAYVFVRTGNTWTLQQKLIASDGADGDYFGYSVAISGDTALIGANEDDVDVNENQGSAYVFVRVGTTWLEQRKITAADGAPDDYFGEAVALDGETAVVGAYCASVGADAQQGAAYVFERSFANWDQQAKLTISDGEAGDYFGCSVALEDDTVLVGAQSDDVGPNAGQGSAYVLARSGGLWTRQAQLTADDGAASDWFGNVVDLSGDTAVVGAYEDDVGANTDQGSAYVYARSGGVWTQEAKLTGAAGTAHDRLGTAVAVSGNIALAGTYFGGEGTSGSVSVFQRSGSTWTEEPQLTATDGTSSDYFGRSLALSGHTALVGAALDDVGATSAQGSAFMFLLDGLAPTTSASLTPAANAAGWNKTAVTVALSAADAVSGVAATEFRLAGDSTWTTYAAPFVVSGNGVKSYEYRSTDVAGNVEATQSVSISIDASRPITKALSNVSVRRGRKVTMRYRVNELTPKATVTIKIYKGRALKKTLRLGVRRTNTALSHRWTCNLARGSYTWKVYATDLAGNKQLRIGYKTLVVR